MTHDTCDEILVKRDYYTDGILCIPMLVKIAFIYYLLYKDLSVRRLPRFNRISNEVRVGSM